MERLLSFIFCAVLFSINNCTAQELIRNGGFNETTNSWTTGCSIVEASYYEDTYGGTSGTNHVAEVDDESCFYQDVCILPGMNYVFSLKASRRTGATASDVITHITISGLNSAGVVVGNPYVDMDFSRNNTTFSFTPVTGIPAFFVPVGTDVVRLRVSLYDNTPVTSTLGMVVDDLSLMFMPPVSIISNDSICYNNIGLAVSVNNFPISSTSYSWSFGADATPATSIVANPVVKWNTTGKKTIGFIVGNGVCNIDTITKSVYIRDTVPPPIVASPVIYCTGMATIPLTATGSNLLWYANAVGGLGTTTAPIPNTIVGGNTDYYVSQGKDNCESSRAAISVEVYNAVVANFNYSVKNGCKADTVIFNNTSTIGNYKWQFGNGDISTNKDPIQVYTKHGNYTVKLSVSDLHCADDTAQQISLQHPLTAGFTADNDTICQGEVVTFTNTSVATGPAYTWRFDKSDTTGVANPQYAFTHPGAYDVQLMVRDFLGCVDSADKIIIVDTVYLPILNVDDSNVCNGAIVHFSVLNDNAAMLQWDFGDGTEYHSEYNIGHEYTVPGTYTVKYIAQYARCPDIVLLKSINVKPYPIVNIGPDTTFCPNDRPLEIVDRGTDTNDDVIRLWNTGETGRSINIQGPGIYYLTADLHGCSTTDSIGIKKGCYAAIPNAFSPNNDGVNDYFFPRQLLSSNVSAFSLSIFNRWGQLIYETNETDGRGWDGNMNGTLQSEGVYVYLIKVDFANGLKEQYKGNLTLFR